MHWSNHWLLLVYHYLKLIFFYAVKCNLKELTTKSAWMPRSAVFSMRMLGGWPHWSCDSLARSVFPSCWVLLAIFFPSRPSTRPVPFLLCGGSWLGCTVVPVMGALFQSRGWLPMMEAPGYFRRPTSILAMQLLILNIHVSASTFVLWLKATFQFQCFLYYFTERRRSEEELREMDSKNKITEDMVGEFGTG